MAQPLITFVLCFYNEEDYLAATLASLAAQADRRFTLRLVDNRSDDRSVKVAREAMKAMPDIACEILSEPRPGKLWALNSGCDGITTPYVGTLDADTIYPPEYVSHILAEFAANSQLSAVLALHEDEAAGRGEASLSKWFQTRLHRGHCHGGGAGQAFRRDALEAAGGFDPARWPYVLEDHEIIHAVRKFGPLAYRRDHTFRTSDRRSDREDCSWSLIERLGYKLLPASAGQWYFRQVLGPRFERRGLRSIALRDGDWREDQA